MAREYDNEIEKEAVDFLAEHEEMIVAALVAGGDWDYNDIEDLDSSWHEQIVDRSYTLQDAAYILGECHEQETDRGLWEGLSAEDAMSAQAAYSYANDVWFKCQEFYDEMKGRMTELVDDSADNKDPGSLGDTEGQAAQQAYDEFERRNGPAMYAAVERDSDDERSQIHDWLTLNAAAGTWGGYPVGGSYIDSRCGSGHGMLEIKEYVDFDREFAQKVPWLNGKGKSVVQARYDELVEMSRAGRTKTTIHPNGEKPEVYLKRLTDAIWEDSHLSVTNIREIATRLMGRVG